MEKRKLFKYFYITTLFILLAIGAYPLYCGMRMIINSISEKSLYIYIDYIDKAGIVPFTAITLSIIIGFAILPILQKVKINFSIIAGIIISSIIFVIVEIFVENMATIQGFNERIMLTRFMPPEEYFMSVADGIPLYIKIHYYIFSLLLVIISIMFLYNLSQWFIFGAKKTITKRALVLQGIRLCCILSFVYLVQ